MAEREILFRGKLKDKDEWIGEWIEGIYCPCYWDLYMRRVEKPRIIILSNKKKTDGLWREVIPETVGQYTGLKDKNGVRIFEGDIVSIAKYGGLIYKVVYVPCRYELVNSKGVNCFVLDIYKSENIEVIGNIHDNPELLGGENNGINR